jgi:threonine-phosphate decarboxylase
LVSLEQEVSREQERMMEALPLRPMHGGQLRQIAECFKVPVSELLDFSANINPEGPPPAVLSYLRTALDNPSIVSPSIVANYPDLDELELRQALAGYAGVRSENIAVANGLVPLLDAALRVLTIRSCLVPVPAFAEYRRTLERSRVEMIPHILAAESGFKFRAADLLSDDLFKKDLLNDDPFNKDRFSKDLSGRPGCAILLANPQNPSGVLCSRETLLQIAEEASQKNVFVLLDEAFIDYSPGASLATEVDRFPNLIVFRSVTKFFGMAGLRVAYAAANAELGEQIRASIAPWSVTTLASLAAGRAVQDETYARHTVALNRLRREQMRTSMERLGIHVYPSAANFLLLRLPAATDCEQLWQRLIRDHGIVLRNCANYEGLHDGHLRTAIRSEAENERLIAALAREIEGNCHQNEYFDSGV